MITMLSLTILAITTMFGVAAATALSWMLLRIAFALMQPATARRVPARTELVHGTAQLARAYASNQLTGLGCLAKANSKTCAAEFLRPTASGGVAVTLRRSILQMGRQ